MKSQSFAKTRGKSIFRLNILNIGQRRMALDELPMARLAFAPPSSRSFEPQHARGILSLDENEDGISLNFDELHHHIPRAHPNACGFALGKRFPVDDCERHLGAESDAA